ncbi:MAG: Primosomal protein N [Berkelbacteria bacterium GW2011_GWA1_36_9]|uniref:Primosomal protein N n=1 Tax=Berkelbacteria bacterium GW2011_GWA1_36_9 TaxID=1618331 RepID=A0A0G0INA3_9BACT|nr:MAG: Primosomal protein N [Berkelbacteria bacterium GW2011_GWA1_36_9]
MQIARVVPKTRTQKTGIFDYSIPPALLPYIQIGLLVEIPFSGRKLEGIIIELKRSSPIPHLSSLISIIDPEPVVDKIHIKLAEWMADYYLAPFGKTLFENIVPPAKRMIKNKNFKRSTTSTPAIKIVPHKSSQYLIMGDFSDRLKFYFQAIKKTLAQNKSVIILIPDLALLHFFTRIFQAPYSIIHSKMTLTERWLEWEKIRQGKVKIIIGSQSALFVPAQNLGLIIIDQEENETYKNDRSPRFHAVKVAETLSKLTGVNLLLGSLTPRIESYFQSLKNVYILKKTSKTKDCDITTINNVKKNEILSLPLQEKIAENLKLRKKIILVLNRKGEGQLFSVTTNKLAKLVKNLWPQTRIVRLEEGMNFSNLNKNWDIAIATTYALKFQFPPIGLVGIIDADYSLNFPDFRSSEKNFQILYKFLKIGEQGIIQTNLENNPVIEAVAKLNYEKFFLDELKIRHQYNFPPFTKLIRLLYKNPDEEKTQKEAQKIYQKLAPIGIPVFGPAPAFYSKKRNYYRFQIIIKISDSFKKDQTLPLFNFLRALPKGWIVDVDPMDLL